MLVFIALIRGINVGGHKKIRMADLKASCEALELRNVRTLLQSGNVVFETDEKDRARLAQRIQSVLGVEAKVILRTAAELKKVVAANPMPDAAERGPSHFIVVFLAEKPAAAAMKSLREAYSGPETMELNGAELYIEYGSGMGQSKLTNVLIERKLGVAGTSRNWNTVMKLLEMTTA